MNTSKLENLIREYNAKLNLLSLEHECKEKMIRKFEKMPNEFNEYTHTIKTIDQHKQELKQIEAERAKVCVFLHDLKSLRQDKVVPTFTKRQLREHKS